MDERQDTTDAVESDEAAESSPPPDRLVWSCGARRQKGGRCHRAVPMPGMRCYLHREYTDE